MECWFLLFASAVLGRARVHSVKTKTGVPLRICCRRPPAPIGQPGPDIVKLCTVGGVAGGPPPWGCGREVESAGKRNRTARNRAIVERQVSETMV